MRFEVETESGAAEMVALEVVPRMLELLFVLLPEFLLGLASSGAA